MRFSGLESSKTIARTPSLAMFAMRSLGATSPPSKSSIFFSCVSAYWMMISMRDSVNQAAACARAHA